MNEINHILEEINALKYSENYRRLYDAIKSNTIPIEDCSSWGMKQPRMIIELTLLTRGRLNHIFSRDTIKYKHVKSLLSLLIYLYYVYKPQKLDIADVKKIFNIYDRVLLYSDDFDKCFETSAPTICFYKKLKCLNWTKESTYLRKKFFRKIQKEINYPLEGLGTELDFMVKGATEYIIASSAVQNDRVEIVDLDVFNGYTTFFKLLKQDITKIGVVVDRSDEELNRIFEEMGYCGGVSYTVLLDAMRDISGVE